MLNLTHFEWFFPVCQFYLSLVDFSVTNTLLSRGLLIRNKWFDNF